MLWPVARQVRTLTGTFGTVAPLVPPRWVPTQATGSTRFVGRLVEMWKIHSALHPEAEEYALRFGAAYPGGVFWLRAYGSHDPGDLAAEELEARRSDELRRIAQRLGVNVADRAPEELHGLLASAIEERDQNCLWVGDDLPAGLSGDQVHGWLAPHPLGRALQEEVFGGPLAPVRSGRGTGGRSH